MFSPVAMTWTNSTCGITATAPVHSSTPVFVSIIRVGTRVVTSVVAIEAACDVCTSREIDHSRFRYHDFVCETLVCINLSLLNLQDSLFPL